MTFDNKIYIAANQNENIIELRSNIALSPSALNVVESYKFDWCKAVNNAEDNLNGCCNRHDYNETNKADLSGVQYIKCTEACVNVVDASYSRVEYALRIHVIVYRRSNIYILIVQILQSMR